MTSGDFADMFWENDQHSDGQHVSDGAETATLQVFGGDGAADTHPRTLSGLQRACSPPQQAFLEMAWQGGRGTEDQGTQRYPKTTETISLCSLRL